MATEFTFNEERHEYRLDGIVIPSVSAILRPIVSFDGIDPDVLERKRELGHDAHLACELYDLGELDPDLTLTIVMDYVNAWRRFLRETGAHVLMNEQRLYHPVQRYAGTLDRVVVMPDKSQMLLDIKTGEPMPSHGPQLAAYRLLLDANSLSEPGMRRATVQLRPDGTYTMKQHADPNDMSCFLALLNLWRWKESHP